MRFVHIADDTTIFASDNDTNNVHATVLMKMVGVNNWLRAKSLLSTLVKLYIWQSPTKKTNSTKL